MKQYRYTKFDPQIEIEVDKLIARMTLRDKVMQMTQINIKHHGR